jgi:O-acetyl-ADP-ribose deacetylase (regulator of RNase III)
VQEEFLDGRVIVATGDITEETSDAIVNAANSTLLGGGGVDGAIHRKGGGRILAECRKIRETEYPKGLPTGKAVITTGGDLPARYVIHTVGPIYGLNNVRDAELLADCYRNCLALVVTNGLKTVSFPSISTGAFGYPKDEAARVSSGAISEFLGLDSSISQVRLVFFSASDTENFVQYCEFSG